jgi:hypothetical protein
MLRRCVGGLVFVVIANGGCGGDDGSQIPSESSSTTFDETTQDTSAASTSAISTTTAADSTGGPGTTATSAAPDVGDEGFEPVRFAVISDLNGSYGSTTYAQSVHDAVAAVRALQPDLVLSTGDLVAGQQAGLDYEGMWAGFHAAVSDQLAADGLPFAITPGNHDASGYASFAMEREIFVQQWQPRKPALEYVDDSGYPLRYSFVAGPALFVSLDSTTIGALSDEQMSWIDAQLAARSELPIKIVYGHVPLVPFAVGREDEVIGDPDLEALLEAHDVTMFISGHHHAYYPGRRGELRHVSTSCVGSGPRSLIGTDTPSPRSILVVELDARGTVASVEALAGAAYDTPIARADLPEALGYGAWTVTRDDLF